MKRLLLITLALLFTSSAIAEREEVEITNEYTIEVVGINPIFYEFTPLGNPNVICMWNNIHEVIACFDKPEQDFEEDSWN